MNDFSERDFYLTGRETQSEIVALRKIVAKYERNSRRLSWLCKQMGRQLRFLPSRLLRKLRRRRGAGAAPSGSALTGNGMRPQFDLAEGGNSGSGLMPQGQAWTGGATMAKRLAAARADAMVEVEQFRSSEVFRDLVDRALSLEPNIGVINGEEGVLVPPFHDDDYWLYLAARELVPEGSFDSVVLMPFGKLGGADFIAGILAKSLAENDRVLILRTEQSDWERPDWFPESAPSVDLSGVLSPLTLRQKAKVLYLLLAERRPRRIFNVNSRLGFQVFEHFGRRLALRSKLYSYYFCSDLTPEGIEVGYPVWYFSCILPVIEAAIVDTESLAGRLRERYRLPEALARKVRTIYTPATVAAPEAPVVEAQVASRPGRERPLVLWAGRLDRQKRFDLLLQVAKAMPDVDFACWGKAVLDPEPEIKSLPRNLAIHPPFETLDELPLGECDGWLYTSAWDGLPTILIECGALGMPIVASAVGGVPELIDASTGWPVREADSVAAYVAALREMLGDPEARVGRARALRDRVRERHSAAAYRAAVAAL